ncbi:MAG: signal peptidase I [Candidatus Moraniibacteriota bacterium]|nr:MAG: signal peptidase I [Candidatus Moranbacteria bacterium]
MIEEKEQENMKDFIIEVVKMFFLALIIIVPVRMFLFQPFIVRGASMEPNFSEKEYLIINEFGYKNTPVTILGKDVVTVKPRKELKRYEVVVFRAPHDEKQFYIKRIVGLPGETVKIAKGEVTIYNDKNPDGILLNESAYLPEGRKTNGLIEIKLADDEYYVLGDNRPASSDSRMFGPLHKNDVIGRVLLRAWPIGAFDLF